MNKNSVRTKMSVLNAASTMINRLLGMVLNFISRTVFINTLGAEYLGLGGLFGNIFSVISLCELGFGAAFCQSLYKPIANRDEIKVCAIMNYFTAVYKKIALVSGALSVAVMPFLDVLIKGQTKVQGLYCIYVLFMLHNTVSFLLTPKRMLVVCDQRMYVSANIRSLFSVVIFFSQIAVLKLTENYMLYLSVRIILLAAESVAVNVYADRRYKFLQNDVYPTSEYKSQLFLNVKALVLHKVGAVLNYSTDNLLISYYLGLSCMGKYSNYALIITSVSAFVDIAIGAVSSSVGNLSASADANKNESIMRRMMFVNFVMVTGCSAVLLCTLDPLVEIWLGREMRFTLIETSVIVASFYFSCIRDPVQMFVNSYGIFKPTRYMNLARAGANLMLSAIFIKSMGITGVFCGTVLSVVLVPLWYEPYALYKYGFAKKVGCFYLEYVSYILSSAVICILCIAMTRDFEVSLMGIAMRGMCALGVSIAITVLLFFGKCIDCMGMLMGAKKRLKGVSFKAK